MPKRDLSFVFERIQTGFALYVLVNGNCISSHLLPGMFDVLNYLEAYDGICNRVRFRVHPALTR